MSWLRIDDGFAEHPKVMGLSDRAFRSHVKVMCWCARRDTGGRFPSSLLADYRISNTQRIELQEAGVWEDYAGGFQVHDWRDYNRDPEMTAQIKGVRAAAGAVGGQRSGEARRQAKSKQIASTNEANERSKREPPSPTPSPEGSNDPSDQSDPALPLPKRTSPTASWKESLRERVSGRVEDFESSWRFHTNSKYYAGKPDKCQFLEDAFEADAKRWAARPPAQNGRIEKPEAEHWRPGNIRTFGDSA